MCLPGLAYSSSEGNIAERQFTSLSPLKKILEIVLIGNFEFVFLCYFIVVKICLDMSYVQFYFPTDRFGGRYSDLHVVCPTICWRMLMGSITFIPLEIF